MARGPSVSVHSLLRPSFAPLPRPLGLGSRFAGPPQSVHSLVGAPPAGLISGFQGGFGVSFPSRPTAPPPPRSIWQEPRPHIPLAAPPPRPPVSPRSLARPSSHVGGLARPPPPATRGEFAGPIPSPCCGGRLFQRSARAFHRPPAHQRPPLDLRVFLRQIVQAHPACALGHLGGHGRRAPGGACARRRIACAFPRAGLGSCRRRPGEQTSSGSRGAGVSV